MADVTAIAAGLAARIATTGINAFGYAPGAIVTPCAVVIPNRPAILYGQTLDGETTVNLLAIVLVSAANDNTGQLTLNAVVASSGAKSVAAAVQTDPSLGGTCEFAVVTQVMNYGLVEYAGQQYMGCTFTVTVGAHL